MKKKPTLEERKQNLDMAFSELGEASRGLIKAIKKEILKLYLRLKKFNRGFKK